LTTAFMERIVKLKDMSFSGSKVTSVKCSFKDNKVHIAMSSRANLFEARSIYKSILDVEDIHTFLAQMNALFEIVKVLKLNQRLGL